MNFYENYLDMWRRLSEEKKNAKKVIYPEELNWVRTRQDARVALLASQETGFRTWGTCTMIAEIPPGWHTGKHSHGEEAIYIVKGSGFSIVNGQRFNWEEGSCLRIPFGSIHQHYNTSDVPALYYSAMAPHLEYLCLVSKFDQFEDCGETKSIPNGIKTSGDYDSQGKRIVLHIKDAPVTVGAERPQGAPVTQFVKTKPKEMQTVDPKRDRAGRTIHLMGSMGDFMGEEVEMTSIFCYHKGDYSMKHAHMEAIIYVLKGEGYSVVDEEKIPWKEGTCFHVQGPQTPHQFFATSNSESWLLRTHFGIRFSFFQPIAKEPFPYLYLAPGKGATG